MVIVPVPVRDIAVQTEGLCKEHEDHIDFFECLECGRTIYNPVCPQCLTDEFVSWLDNYPSFNKKRILNEINGFISKNKHLEGHSEICVACNKSGIYECPYCFSDFLFDLIKKERFNKKMRKEFLVFFNFDAQHNGYWKEAEKLGIV